MEMIFPCGRKGKQKLLELMKKVTRACEDIEAAIGRNIENLKLQMRDYTAESCDIPVTG
jgi:hypothetical protein